MTNASIYSVHRFDGRWHDYSKWFLIILRMMASSNENIFRGTGPLFGELTGHRWIPLTNASEAELWFFLWFAPK